MTRTSILLAAIALAIFAACGDDDADPSPTPTPVTSTDTTYTPPTGVPLASEHALDFIAADGDIYRVPSGGGDVFRLMSGEPCTHKSELGRQLLWSPSGDLLACLSLPQASFDLARIVLFEPDGAVASEAEIPRDAIIEWSPDGSSIAFYNEDNNGTSFTVLDRDLGIREKRSPILRDAPSFVSSGRSRYWSPNSAGWLYRDIDNHTQVLTLDTTPDLDLGAIGYPLTWRNDDQFFVARNYSIDDRGFQTYEVYLVDSDGGEERLADLDSGPTSPEPDINRQGWVSPDGRYVVLLTRQGGTSLGLGVYDLNSAAFTPIAGSSVTFGSDHIPDRYVWFSDDSTQVFWYTEMGSIHSASVDGSDSTDITSAAGVEGGAFSPDYKSVAQLTFTDDGPHFTVLDPSGINIGLLETLEPDIQPAFAWYPIPSG